MFKYTPPSPMPDPTHPRRTPHTVTVDGVSHTGWPPAAWWHTLLTGGKHTLRNVMVCCNALHSLRGGKRTLQQNHHRIASALKQISNSTRRVRQGKEGRRDGASSLRLLAGVLRAKYFVQEIWGIFSFRGDGCRDGVGVMVACRFLLKLFFVTKHKKNVLFSKRRRFEKMALLSVLAQIWWPFWSIFGKKTKYFVFFKNRVF